MPFVDANRYLKVQDNDLDQAFTKKKTHHHQDHTDGDDSHDNEEDDKFSRASFESFQIELSSYKEQNQSKWKSWIIPAIIVIVVVIAIVLTVIFIVRADKYHTSQGLDDEGNAVYPPEPLGDTIERVKRRWKS